MLQKIRTEIKVALDKYWNQKYGADKAGVVNITTSQGPIEADFFVAAEKLFIFLSAEEILDLEVFTGSIVSNPPPVVESPDIFEILLVIADFNVPEENKVIARGIRLVSLQNSIATIIGLPAGWRDAQRVILKQTLEPVIIDGKYELASLYALDNESKVIAQDLLKESFVAWNPTHPPLIYLRAEAGKGKSTLLADTTLSVLDDGSGPLPLYLPLRTLQRGAGISWAGIAERLGVLGNTAENLRLAVSVGLVTLVLDGLDEVAGRYDPAIVLSLLNLVYDNLCTETTRIFVSGRTTESFFLDHSKSAEIGIELPESEEDAFKKYVALVLKTVTPTWPSVSKRVTEPSLRVGELRDEAPTEIQIAQMLEWIQAIFDDVGKERSLFFVQSLACIARTYQLDGNKALIIRSHDSINVTPADLYQVCVLAGTLACIREQDKVEDIARPLFTPVGQLKLLTLFSLLSSAEGHLASKLKTPSEFALCAFDVDPVNQNEEFTAILRQVQKHALLFNSAQVGDWKPQFLSEWVRAAFLCRAWINRESLDIPSALISEIVARALRSRIAYQALFPSILTPSNLLDLEELVVCLCREAMKGSPEATSNYWMLMSGLGAELREKVALVPENINEYSDLSEVAFEEVSLPKQFSANSAFLTSSEFTDCQFADNVFTDCEFNDAIFNNCDFRNVTFKYCYGPIFFDSCRFDNVLFEDNKSPTLPCLLFSSCDLKNVTIVQNAPPRSSGQYEPVAVFCETFGERPLHEICKGDWLGFDPFRVEGYSTEEVTPLPSEEQCLLKILRPFFPVRAGIGGQLQARRYIRSSALGRGTFPSGSPSIGLLTSFLEAEGFTNGGRDNHIYAPWSSVVGASNEAVELRNELLSFVRNKEKGRIVLRLLDKIKRAAGW